MTKLPAKIVILLGIVCCLPNFHPGAIALEEKKVDEKTEAGKISGTELSGILFTTGVFLSKVRHEDKKWDDVQYPGGLAHVPLLTWPLLRNKGVMAGFALSGGVGLSGPNLTENLQVTIGPSLLFRSEKYTLAYTLGGIVRNVGQLRPGIFFSFTANFSLDTLTKTMTQRNGSVMPKKNANSSGDNINSDETPIGRESTDAK